MKVAGRISAILAVLFLLASCGEKEELYLEVSLAEDVVSNAAGTVFVQVSSNTSWTLSIEDGPSSWASLSAASGEGSRNSIVLSYEANKGEQSRSLVLKASATSGSLSSSVVLVQEAPVPDVPSSGNGGIASSAPFDWMELPATSASDKYDFLWHTFEYGGRTMRNFSCYWDYDNLVSIWVAYPLTSTYMSGPGYEYAWYGTWADDWTLGIDPLLPREKQAVLSARGYGNTNNTSLSGAFYARGHQIPRADRKLCLEASDQTCYGINMTPQLNKSGSSTMDFNGSIWASLEGKVRNWAQSSDTLYVVTGCTLNGSTYYSTDNLGKKVTVPTGYFKAILRYAPKTSSTGLGHSGFMGCAFYLDHKLYSTSAKVDKTYCMSIDALEAKLGIDLFVNLPAKVGNTTAAAIEAEDPTRISWWW